MVLYTYNTLYINIIVIYKENIGNTDETEAYKYEIYNKQRIKE